MSKLNAAHKTWLLDLGAILRGGSAASALPASGDQAQPSASAAPTTATLPTNATSATTAAPAAPATPATPQQIEALQDRRREFKRARAQWVVVKKRAESDLELVKAGAKKAYAADPAQFPKVVAGCAAIDEILDHLDDELRDTLDRYASTPIRSQNKIEALAATASQVLDRYQRYVSGNALMRAIDQKEFADVMVHAPVMKALSDLKKALA